VLLVINDLKTNHLMTKVFEDHHNDYEEITTETMPAYSQVLHVQATGAATFRLHLIKLALLH